MKRVLILALALMFVGLVAFAADNAPAVKLSMWGEGDLFLIDSASHWGWGTGWSHQKNETGGWYTTLGLSYDGNNYGYMSQLEFGQDLLAAFNPVSGTAVTLSNGAIPVYLFRQFDAYYKLFDGKVKVTGGKILDGEYGVTDVIEGDGISAWMGSSVEQPLGLDVAGAPVNNNIYVGDFGGMVQVYPIDGLNIGFGVSVPSTALIEYWGGGQVQDWSNSMSVAASYAVPQLLTLSGFFKSNGDLLQVSINVTAMKNLTLVASFENAFATGESGQGTYMSGFVSVGYTAMAPWTFAISAYDTALTYSGAPTGNAGSDWGVEAKAEYALMSNTNVGLKLGYENSNWAAPINGWIQGNVEGMVVYPYITQTFDNGASLGIGFQWTSGETTQYVGNQVANGSYWSIPVKFIIAF
ncbi:MAG: hypothetical protein ABSG63_03375 [Spirochaetia bacterium]|jgi:hypothetical protein